MRPVSGTVLQLPPLPWVAPLAVSKVTTVPSVPFSMSRYVDRGIRQEASQTVAITPLNVGEGPADYDALFHKVISALQANDIGAAIPRPLAWAALLSPFQGL